MDKVRKPSNSVQHVTFQYITLSNYTWLLHPAKQRRADQLLIVICLWRRRGVWLVSNKVSDVPITSVFRVEVTYVSRIDTEYYWILFQNIDTDLQDYNTVS
jgi:hypothetical protein